MRVSTRNKERTVQEMGELFNWCVNTFDPKVWTYGKEPGFLQNTLCDGPYDVEWVDFPNEKNATMFMLRWP